jgi:hypothetical protein
MIYCLINYRLIIIGLVVIYAAFVLVLTFSLATYPLLALFALIFNLCVVMFVGRLIVRAILFPYGNKFVTRMLDN